MPMTGEVLGPLMQGHIDALSNEQKKDRGAVFKAFAAAVVEHIQSAAVVVGTSATGGPVTGTVT